MKAIFALFLCVIVYASASPRCSEEEFKECNPSGEEEVQDIETVEQLDDMCRFRNTVLKCEVDYMSRCTNYPPSGRGDYIKESYRMFGAFCDKSNPLRKKFLDNAKCMNTASKEIAEICRFEEGGPHDVFCRNVKKSLKCSVQRMAEKCGEEAKQVYVFALNPKYQLRLAGCV